MNSFTIRREKRAVFLLQGPWTSTACRKGNRMWPLREKPPPMSTPSASRCRLGWPRAAVQKAAHGKTSLTWVGFHLPLDFSLLRLFFCIVFCLKSVQLLNFLLVGFWWMTLISCIFLGYDWAFQDFEFGQPLLWNYNLLCSPEAKQLPFFFFF